MIDRLLLAAGLVLAITGLWWMWTGWDIVRDERGMAAFISGAVMLSGGLIVAAVAWAVMRLQPRSAAAARSSDIDEVEAFAAPETGGIAPTAVGAAAAVAVAGAAVAAHAVADEKPEAGPVAAAADDDTTRPEDIAPPVEIPPTEEAAEERIEETPFRRPSIDDLVRRSVADADEPPPIKHEPLFPRFERFRREPEPEAPLPEPPAVQDHVEDKTDDDDGLTSVAPLGPIFPAARGRKEEGPTVESFSETFELPEKPVEEVPTSEQPEPETPAPEPAVETAEEGDWFDQAERSLERALGRTSPASESEEVAGAEPEPPKAPPAVTGRYSSGDTHYTMYDDGSIEAQTPDGVMRFASLIELRRFVEQRT